MKNVLPIVGSVLLIIGGVVMMSDGGSVASVTTSTGSLTEVAQKVQPPVKTEDPRIPKSEDNVCSTDNIADLELVFTEESVVDRPVLGAVVKVGKGIRKLLGHDRRVARRAARRGE